MTILDFNGRSCQNPPVLPTSRGTTAVPMSLSMKVIVKHQVWCFLSKVCSAKRHNVSFVGSGGFYSIFQHTDGNRSHSMACRGQHGSEFTEPEMIAKIIRIGT